ncbi:MAG TPA: hypothetical protein ENO21_01240 [Firmicutes bacterium]|nr:hypothetical protein [Bacillota bacterium]
MINEYLDGEIGLADKAQLEQIMADNPRVRAEYERLRKLGTMIGLMPEVRVHPYRFRARLGDALDSNHKGYFTPQRAFSAAMLVVLVVFVVTFGLFAYQQQIISGSSYVVGTTSSDEPVAAAAHQYFVMDTGVGAEQFFSRLALEHQLGILDSRLMSAVSEQTGFFEGATCREGSPLAPLRFAEPLPHNVKLTLSGSQVGDLAGLAEELSGNPARVTVPGAASLRGAGRLPAGISELDILTIELKFI